MTKKRKPYARKDLASQPFAYQDAIKRGLTRHDIRNLLESGEIERLSRGIYQYSKNDISEEVQFKVASLKVGSESAVCLLSALAFYGLTDDIPTEVWLLVNASKRVSNGKIKLLRSRYPNWDIGITKTDNYKITSVERTVIDALVYKRLLGKAVSIEALRRALRKKTSIEKLFDMATKLDVLGKVRSYLEPFA